MSEQLRVSTIEGMPGHPALCVLPEIEKEDELFEIIWTLREEGSLAFDQIVESCTLKDCKNILKDLSKNGWIDIKGQTVELFRRVRKELKNWFGAIVYLSGCFMTFFC